MREQLTTVPYCGLQRTCKSKKRKTMWKGSLLAFLEVARTLQTAVVLGSVVYFCVDIVLSLFCCMPAGPLYNEPLNL